MSRDKTKRTRTHEEKKKLMVRIVALIMAFLMVGGMAYYTIYVLTSTVGAAELVTEDVPDTSSLKNSEDVLISVGLMYGSSLTKAFALWSDEGYTLGSQRLVGEREFVGLWDIDTPYISCTVDDCLRLSSGSFVLAEGEDDTVLGGYHLQVETDGYDKDELAELIDDTERELRGLGLYSIPSYIDGGYALRIGAFASSRAAREYLDEVEDIFDSYVSVVSPSSTAVSVADPDNERILFEFDCNAELELGLAAHENANGNTYIATPAGNLYDGVFCFKRYDNGDVEGVQLVNILPLEAYIAGVLPYETSNTWPLETLKAFAVTIRSYTLSHLNKHFDRYGFDLCNTTDCQVYKGAGRINRRILDAVLGTAGQILVYGDEIVNAYYSSSAGGVTVSAEDAWGGIEKLPYLKAVETPWERYMIHNNGFWMYEISPSALCELLNQKGYTTLSDAIEDMEILELAEGSTYIKKLRITDIHGESVTIEYTDNVRIALTPYVKSSNFVVGRGSVEYCENVVIEENYTSLTDEEENEYIGSASSGVDSGYTDVDGCYVITADEIDRHYTSIWTNILTGDETVLYDKIDFFVMSSQNAYAFLGDEYKQYSVEEETVGSKYNTQVIADRSDDEVVYKIAYASNEDDFIFVGKGWGHGVGISQYGARDLAEMGYSYEDILYSYFTDVAIINY